ncbi:hypothetical protein [Actinoplanes flavus]|uniref:YD repeat-containing protein n=1 Tax=Actinoplanes flavus TaxID=2820290 RepID=A0ABS3UG49_9ACTN|nr:hypothetical protein [Actinoplanes flavus]MBO3737755.1 hypothetical protein [Actinoplanes flavus]
MGHEPGETAPYSSETYANTHTPWVSGDPLKVDVEGLRDYAKDMLDQRFDLAGRAAHLKELFSMPVEAWNGMVLGEAAFLRSQLLGNASELSAYLGNLGETLFNVGSAAQTIADIYGNGDAIGAADLNDVLFAFGDKNVPRPAGLPKGIGQTYEEALRAGTAGVTPPTETSAEWGPATSTVQSPYQSTLTSENVVTGQTREVVTTTIPGTGTTVVTTTVYNSKGGVVSTSSTRTTTSYDATRNQQVKVVTSGDTTTTTTTTYDGKGEMTGETAQTSTGGRREVTIDPETGARTETTYNAKGDVTDRIVIGAETEGQPGVQKPLNEKYDPYLNGSL